MRIDGRTADVLREITVQRHFTKHADGSVLISFGDTKVICTAMIEARVPPWLRDSGRGWVTAEYAMLPGASRERIRREAYTKGRSQEISRLIGRSLRAVVDLKAMGECMVTVDCDVIQADGGTRTAAISGGFIALHDALSTAVATGRLSALPILDTCAAVSVGVVERTPLLDLCYAEDVRADVDMNVVMNGAGAFIEVQGSAEGAVFSRAEMDTMLGLAESGIAQLATIQKEALTDD